MQEGDGGHAGDGGADGRRPRLLHPHAGHPPPLEGVRGGNGSCLEGGAKRQKGKKAKRQKGKKAKWQNDKKAKRQKGNTVTFCAHGGLGRRT